MQGTQKLEWLEGNLKRLNKTGLNVLIHDAQLRMISQSAGSDSKTGYIEYQQDIIDLVKKELSERLESGQ